MSRVNRLIQRVLSTISITILICLQLGVQTACGEPLNNDQVPPNAEVDASTEATDDIVTGKEKNRTQKLIKAVDTSRDYLSKNILTISKKVDTYFATEENFYDSNETYMILGSSLIYDQKKNLIYETSFNLKLDLPNINRRLNLVIEGKESEKGSGEIGKKNIPDIANDQVSRPIQASLQYVLRQAKRWRISGSLGLDLPDDPFARVRARRKWQNDNWNTNLSQTITQYFEDVLEAKTSHEVNIPTGKDNLLRNALNLYWTDQDKEVLTLTEDILFYHIISSKLFFRYQIGSTTTNHPTTRVTEYRLIPTFRKDIHKGWLFMDIGPRFRIKWNEAERVWQKDHAMIITFELFFKEGQ